MNEIYIKMLPSEIWLQIFEGLSLITLAQVRLVNKQFYLLVKGMNLTDTFATGSLSQVYDYLSHGNKITYSMIASVDINKKYKITRLQPLREIVDEMIRDRAIIYRLMSEYKISDLQLGTSRYYRCTRKRSDVLYILVYNNAIGNDFMWRIADLGLVLSLCFRCHIKVLDIEHECRMYGSEIGVSIFYDRSHILKCLSDRLDIIIDQINIHPYKSDIKYPYSYNFTSFIA